MKSKAPIYKWSKISDPQLQRDTVVPALKQLSHSELTSLGIRLITSNIGKRKKSPLLTMVSEATRLMERLIETAIEVAQADDRSTLERAIRSWSDARVKSGYEITARRVDEGDPTASRAFDLFLATAIERGFGRDPDDFQVG